MASGLHAATLSHTLTRLLFVVSSIYFQQQEDLISVRCWDLSYFHAYSHKDIFHFSVGLIIFLKGHNAYKLYTVHLNNQCRLYLFFPPFSQGRATVPLFFLKSIVYLIIPIVWKLLLLFRVKVKVAHRRWWYNHLKLSVFSVKASKTCF